MINFAALQPTSQIIILVLLLIMFLVNGYIMTSAILRTGRWGIGLIAFFHILLYYVALVTLSTYLYEIELGVEFHPVSYYFAILPLWIYQTFLVINSCEALVLFYKMRIYQQNTITKASIKEAVDNLSAGLSLSLENSFVILSNWQIDRLCHTLTGQDLQNGEVFWNTLTEGVLREGNQRWVQAVNPIITLADGRTWSFNRRTIEVEDESIIEITAIDTTDLNSLRIQLEKDNEILEEMGSRLRQYSKNIMEIKAKEERLATKMHIHEELGYALLATRQFFRNKKYDMEIGIGTGEILNLWKKNIAVLQGTMERKKSTALDSLISAAEAVGIEIVLKGALPEDIRGTNLILLVAGECLTNSVRHANATKLYLEIIETEQGYTATFSNDGIIPTSEIIEGGGLSGLRNQIEAIGGAMEIGHTPQFILRVIIPKRGDGYNGSGFDC